jgi:hypothetical protein
MKVDVCIDGRPEMMEAAPAVLWYMTPLCILTCKFD